MNRYKKLNFIIIGIVIVVLLSSLCVNAQSVQSDKISKYLTTISFTMQKGEVMSVFDPGAWGIFSPGEWGMRIIMSYKGEITNLTIGDDDFDEGRYSISTTIFIGHWNGTKIRSNEYENVRVNGFTVFTSWESIK